MNKCISTIEKLRLEKFYLKKEIAYERKRYNDLKSAFIELRREAKDKEMDYKDRSKQQLIDEKMAMQNTIVTLTDEIEALSVKNEEFLDSLSKKEFYKEYRKTKEELKTLKDAHAILINMIRDEELHLQTKSSCKDSSVNQSSDLIKDTSAILGTDLSKVSKNRPTSNFGPLQEIDINTGRNHAGLSSIFSCNAFGGALKDEQTGEQEIDLKQDRIILKNNAEFLSSRLENVDINFLKHKS